MLWHTPPKYPARAPPREGKLQQGKVPSSLRAALREPSVPPSRMRGAPWLRLAPTDLIRLIHRVRRRPWHVPHVASLCLKHRHPKPSSASNPGRSRPSQSVPGVQGAFASKIRFLAKTIRGRKDVMIQQVSIVFVFSHQSLRAWWIDELGHLLCLAAGAGLGDSSLSSPLASSSATMVISSDNTINRRACGHSRHRAKARGCTQPL